MKFGPVPLDEAEGAILAHAQRLDGKRLKKGSRLTREDVVALRQAGFSEIVAAVIEPGDLTEDEAAARIGEAAAGEHVGVGPAATGRVNFFAGAAGIFLPDRRVVDALNAIDPGITLATLGEFEPVEAGRMVATVKIIPLAVPGAAVEAAVRLLESQAAFDLSPYRARRVAVIQTELPTVKGSVLDKTVRALEARLRPSGSKIVAEGRCAHTTEALTGAIDKMEEADLAIIFGASAITDRQDVIPAAIDAAGGRVDHLGMPVDPGNLLLLGELHGRPVLGAPGCARSPKENGFDWVLIRLLADLPVSGEDIRKMGVGGLLMEIASRPQPREGESEAAHRPVVDIVILAAGKSTRMGGPNKLLATFDGVPLIRRSAETALASDAGRVRVVVGHRRDEIVAALDGLAVEIIDNAGYEAGLSTSLIAGFEASAETADGVLVMLADQPLLKATDLDRLIASFCRAGEGSIVLAADRGQPANPAILSCIYMSEIRALSGDIGARGIIAAHRDVVREVEIGRAASLDVDTPEALAEAGGLPAA